MCPRFRSARQFSVRVLRRFVEENFDQLSASLAFTTLLSLVPLVAVILGVMSLFPVFYEMVERLDHFVVRSLLPERSAEMIIAHILEFSQKATHFTLAGLAALIVTILFLLLSVERAFNHVWRVEKDRTWGKRLRLSLMVVVLWPIIVTCVVLAIYEAVTTSLGLIDNPVWLHGIILKLASMVVAAIFFAGLYYAVPNARVGWCDAAWAGGFAASGFALMQKGFEFYLANFPSMTLVYGAFATVPMFLMWMYLSWAVVLLGALVAATLPEFRGSGRG